MRKTILLIFIFAAALAACSTPETTAPPATGEELFEAITIGEEFAPGCSSCHMLGQNTTVGPSLTGIAQLAEERIADSSYTGNATTAAEYIRESILDPDLYVVDGYTSGLMYGFYSEDLTEEQVEMLVDYLIGLE